MRGVRRLRRRRIVLAVTLTDIHTIIRTIDAHREFADKARAAFPPDEDAEPVCYVRLRRFGVKVPKYLTWKGRSVRKQMTWFTASESDRIAAELPTVRAQLLRDADRADEDTRSASTVADARGAMLAAVTARNAAGAAARLRWQRRWAWLHRIDGMLSGLHQQRLLNVWETQALRLAVAAAADTASAAATALEAEFDTAHARSY